MKQRRLSLFIIIGVVFSMYSCSPQATPTTAPTTSTAEVSAPTLGATSPAAPTPIAATSTGATPAIAVPQGSSGMAYPAPETGIPSVLPTAMPLQNYVVFAWNNLGMHCYQRDFSQFLILPPYNNLEAQVVQRGREPRILRASTEVDYQTLENTNPVPYTNFWDYASAYGFNVQPGIGLTGKGTSGSMDFSTDHFVAEGVPLADTSDSGVFNPYPFFVVNVKDSSGNSVAQTVNVAPVSTEMSCYLCHAGDTTEAVMVNIIQSHDKNMGTGFVSQAQAGNPILCDSCHADPAMGVAQNNGATQTLSGAIHTFHANTMTGSQLPQNECYSCHPGPETQCLRGAMATAGVTCQDCHGTMSEVGSSDRTPWVNLPMCQSCHTNNFTRATTSHIDNPNQHLSPNSAALFQNSKAHGGGGIYCEACHGSTHAIYPSMNERDNQQSIRLQGQAGIVSDCSVCHEGQPEGSFFHFGED